MRSNRGQSVATVVVGVAVLLAAPVVQAGPIESGWAGWWAGAWDAVLAVFGASSTETTTEPEPEPIPPPKSEPPATTSDSCPTCGGGDTDGGPSLDPNG